MSERDRIREAARDRDRQELAHLARMERYEVESFLRSDRSTLTPSERELVEDAAREAR